MLLRPGETCWRIERADRVAVIVDAADYFATVRSAMMQARHSIVLVGWDFDTRIMLAHDDDGSAPRRLGRFLSWLVNTRPGLRIHMLKWDLGTLKAVGRGTTPLFILDWITDKRIAFRLDGAHPTSSAHHQKVVVIDDAVAFCGGIDMTADRWDTSEHLDDDPRRRRPTTGRRYPPWHDATTAVDGAAARALGDLARDRWKRATGEDLPEPAVGSDIWPEGLKPTFENVDVGLSRTFPPFGDATGVHEIEALYLAAIAAARRTIYIESQYFASRKIAEAMAARLREPDGPEIVVINPEVADGWLEEAVMGSSRARLLRVIGAADAAGRFRMYTPVTSGGNPIYVHAKIMLVDDRLLRVGSSNLNNRSMGFDTECDLSLEAGPDDRDVAAGILALRDRLLAEHLGVSSADIAAAMAKAGGALIPAIEALRSGGRSLKPFEPPDVPDLAEEAMGENELLDPERPARQWWRLRRLWRAVVPWAGRHLPSARRT